MSIVRHLDVLEEQAEERVRSKDAKIEFESACDLDHFVVMDGFDFICEISAASASEKL